MSGFFGSLIGAISSGVSAVVDPFFNYVTLLLNGDGTNGAQNNNFSDSSPNNFTLTRAGTPTQGTFSPFSQTGWSGYFNGTTDYLTFPTSTTALSFGTAAFTIEGWFYQPVVNPNNGIFQISTVAGGFQASSGVNTISLGLKTAGYTLFIANSDKSSSLLTPPPANVWTHFALVRNANVTTLYINGVSLNSFSDTTNYDGLYIEIGGYYSTAYVANMYVSNFRVVKGTAVYTTNFTPPTAPLTAITGTSLLTLQSNRFVDNSANNFTITPSGTPSIQAFSPFAPSTTYSPSAVGGSGYFGGTTTGLTVAANSATALVSNNFTMEFFVYIPTPSLMSGYPFYTNYTAFGDNAIYFGLHPAASGRVAVWFGNYSTNGPLMSEATLTPANVWVHYALVRNGSTFTLYRDGVSTATGTFSGAATAASNSNYIFVSGDSVGTSGLAGYCSNFRIVNGTAVYTANFTPPTAPLIAITGTSLLLNFTNAGIVDSTAKNDLLTIGDAQVSTSVVKYGTGSIRFDGTGDSVKQPTSVNYGLGTANFTIEMWLYPQSAVGYQCILEIITANPYIFIGINTGSTATPFMFNDGNVIVGSTNFTLNAWQHWAIVRNNGVVTMYLNGLSIGSAAFAGNIGNTNLFYLGANDTNTQNYTGYLDDFRITKGIARYTANFTPPAQAFPVQ